MGKVNNKRFNLNTREINFILNKLGRVTFQDCHRYVAEFLYTKKMLLLLVIYCKDGRK